MCKLTAGFVAIHPGENGVMKQRTQILILLAIVVVLGGAVVVAITRDVRKITHQHGQGGDAEVVEGAACEDCLAEGTQTGALEIEPAGREIEMPRFAPVLPPAEAERTLVRIKTGMGDIEILLFDDLTPRTVGNFLELAGKDFYDGIIFHRVIKGFMVQTGDPEGTGRGGPGYTFADEIVEDLKHSQPGVVSMANSGANTNGSQFFITVKPTPWLDRKHTIFGQVVKGMDVVWQISNVAVGPGDRPLSEIAMDDVTVVSKVAPTPGDAGPS